VKLYRVVKQVWERSPSYPFGHWAFKGYLPVPLPKRLAELRRDALIRTRPDDNTGYLIEPTR